MVLCLRYNFNLKTKQNNNVIHWPYEIVIAKKKLQSSYARFNDQVRRPNSAAYIDQNIKYRFQFFYFLTFILDIHKNVPHG